MRNKIRIFALLTGACAALPAYAGETTAVKCGPNQERVWLYDSLSSFDVAAKLKCGETVEMISRVKGYVKVRTQNGTEGFVPDAAFSDLPPFVDDKDKQATTVAQLAARRSAKPADNPAPAVAVVNPAPPRAISVAPEPASRPASVSNVDVVSAVVVAPAPAPAASSASSVQPSNATVVAAKTSALPTSATVVSVKTSTPALAPAASAAAAAASSPAHTVTVSSSSTTSPAKNGSSSASTAKSPKKPSNSATSTARPAAPAPAPALALPKPAPATTVSTPTTESSAVLTPARETPALHPVKATTAPESEDYPDFEPVSESADPACQLYFSAYGLSPAQFKWFSQNRKKKYPAICPAPDVSRVDFVLIFTHDVDIYSTTLPSPVHTDHNGFSDFSPMTMVDTAVMSGSVADKAHRDYVWVFTMKRGAFDPSRFSPRRRPQFTKSESNSLAGHGGSLKTVDDAFHFMEEQGESR